MRACSSASGGVMFLPDEPDETNVESTAVSYRDLVKEEEEKTEAPRRLFGKKKAASKKVKAA